MECIIEKYETLTTIPPFQIYINRINNRFVFKIKDGYKLELQMSETMKLFGNTKKKIYRQSKKRRKSTTLKVVEVVLVQCSLVGNKYQKKSEAL